MVQRITAKGVLVHHFKHNIDHGASNIALNELHCGFEGILRSVAQQRVQSIFGEGGVYVVGEVFANILVDKEALVAMSVCLVICDLVCTIYYLVTLYLCALYQTNKLRDSRLVSN